MRRFLDELGYPGGSWKRPGLWTLMSVFVTVADAIPPYTGDGFGSRMFRGVGFLVIGGYTAASWRKHRQPPVEPLGRVEWPRVNEG